MIKSIGKKQMFFSKIPYYTDCMIKTCLKMVNFNSNTVGSMITG